MIKISYDIPEKPTIKKTMHFHEGIIDEAREFYFGAPAYRYDEIYVLDDDEKPVCRLRWFTNEKGINEGLLKTRFATNDEFWHYTTNDPRMDFRLLERADVFFVNELDEYSWYVAKLLKQYYPEKHMCFLDPRAAMFGTMGGQVHYADSKESFYKENPYLSELPIMTVKSGIGDPVIKKIEIMQNEYSSIALMNSIRWLSDETKYGDENPDRTIALIKAPVGVDGAAGIARYVLNKAEAIAQSGIDVTPVVDLGLPDDVNQFCDGTGENIWEMFFEPLSNVTLAEAYKSAHVTIGYDAMKSANPWFWEQDTTSDYPKLVRKYLRFNKATREFAEKQYKEIIPENAGRILGVVGRGSDYNMQLPSGMQGMLMKPLGPDEIVEKTIRVMKEQGFDKVFLATEDANVFEKYMNSEIADKTLYVDQERINYNDYSQTSFLLDIYKEMKRDLYFASVRYLGILNILSKCDGLISTTLCGAAKIAWGLNNGKYEYFDVPGIKNIQGDRD